MGMDNDLLSTWSSVCLFFPYEYDVPEEHYHLLQFPLSNNLIYLLNYLHANRIQLCR